MLGLRRHPYPCGFSRPVVDFSGAKRYPEDVFVVTIFVLIKQIFSKTAKQNVCTNPQREHVVLDLVVTHPTILLYDGFQSLIDVFGHRAIAADVKVPFFQHQHLVNFGRFLLDQILDVSLQI